MGTEAHVLLEALSLDAQSLASYQVVATYFAEHFVHPANELYEFRDFTGLFSFPMKAFSYYAELCRMVKCCCYQSAAVEERHIGNRFFFSLRNSCL